MTKTIQTKPWYKNIPNVWIIPEDWDFDDFWNVFNSISTKKFQISNKEIQNNWNYFVVDQWNQLIAWFSNNEEKVFKNTPIIVFGDHTTNVKYIDFNFVIWADWTKLLNNKKWDLYFLYSFLEFNKIPSEWYKRHFSILKQLKILLPPIKEQNKIATILNICNSQIETTKQIIQKIELRNKWLQQQLLTWKKRISWFTEKWTNKQLSDIFNRVTRKNTEWEINVLTISAQRWLINQETYFNKQIASVTLDNYFLLYKWEFAYNKSYSNWYPMWAIKRLNDYEKWVVTTLYICFWIKEELNYSSNFFEKYFEYWLLIRWLTEIAHEWWRAHWLLNVTPSDFFNLKVFIPNSIEQKAIADVLDKATEQLNEYKQKLEKLELQKKGLMQQLLTGKTRVKI